ERLLRGRLRRPVDEPQRAAGGVLRVHLREMEQLEALAEALALELLEDQRIDAEGHREAAAHHELGDLPGVAAEYGLLVHEQPFDDVVAEVEAGGWHRPAGVRHRAPGWPQQLALPARIE